MRLAECRLLADENVDPGVVEYLRSIGQDVVTARDLGLIARPDEEVLRAAVSQGRAMLTHDHDFSELVVARGLPMAGIVLVRPGHMSADFTLGSIRAAWRDNPELPPKFILVVERLGDSVAFRVRTMTV